MRVQMSRRRDQRGAVAIILALLMVVLCIMAAFVLDFGRAYVNKLQAQTAADAAVLAAGRVLVREARSGDCSSWTSDDGLMRNANDAADELRDENLPSPESGEDGDLTFEPCGSNGELKLDYRVSVDSPVGLGQLAVDTDHITLEALAQATVRSSARRPVRLSE